jgi:hypothetical protein
MIADVSDGGASTAGGQLPLGWLKSATVAQVVAVAAGILAMVSWIVMRRIILSTLVNRATLSWLPWKDQWHPVTYAGAGVLVAIVALLLRGRARWLHYPQIGLWLLVLAESWTVADDGLETGIRGVPAWLVAGDVPGVIAIVLLALSLRRPAR